MRTETHDRVSAGAWIAIIVLLGILANVIGMTKRAHSAEPGDPRDYTTTTSPAPRHHARRVAHRPHKAAEPSTDTRIIAMLRQVIANNERLERANERLERELVAIHNKLRPDDTVASLTPPPEPEPTRNPLMKIEPMPIPDPTAPPTIKGYEHLIAKSAKLKDLTPKLASKVAEILAECSGARLTSGFRPGARVRGSGRPSLHSHYPSKAADLAGNPTCIRQHLAKWPGGLSIDYAAVRHYHVSYAPESREWGARFAHYGSRRHARKTRYAAAR